MATVRYQRETEVEQKVVNYATSLGLRAVKVNWRGQRGYPDRLFLIPGGKPLFIEFKRSGEEAEPLQKHIIQELSALGYNVKECDNEEEGKRLVRGALEAARLSKKGC